MHSLVKIIIGVIFVIASVWWIVQGSTVLYGIKNVHTVTQRTALADLITIVNGGIPIFLAFIGLLIIWLEWDNLRMQKEVVEEKKKK